MANNTILSYTAATNIDPVNDYFLEYQNAAGAYMRINRNTIMGVSGAPADISTTQTFTNKILGNSNLVTLLDGGFTLQNNVDTTKRAVFSLTGITTGTTRTYTLPNASSTLADISTVQTFTNKTLTSPVITGGSIDNSTITVDSIAGHTTSTVVSVAGLSISNGVLNSNNSVVTANITDSAVTPAKLLAGTGSSWTWQTWAPSFTNVTVGNATVTAVYTQIGKTVIARLAFVFGSSSAFTGPVSFTLPVTSAAYGLTGTAVPVVGLAWMEDTGNSNYQGNASLTSTTVAQIKVYTGGTYVATAVIGSVAPFTWGVGDSFNTTLIYQAA